MQTRKEASNNLVKYVALSSLGLFAFGAGLYYLIRRSKENKYRERIMRILIDLQRETLPLFAKVNHNSKLFIEETGQVPPLEAKTELLKLCNNITFFSFNDCILFIS